MKRPLPPTYLLGALVSIAFVHVAIPGPRYLAGVWRSLGTVPLAIGMWLNLWADGVLKRSGTAVRPFEDSVHLVSTGPYQYSRHPMYLGMVAIALGVALLAGTLVPMVVVVVLWWALDRHFAQPEERDMTRQFGERYEEYCRHVRRWCGRREARPGIPTAG